jgi:hypothetical protein
MRHRPHIALIERVAYSFAADDFAISGAFRLMQLE